MLNHVDENNRPTMVDVTLKTPTKRIAKAQSKIQLPMSLSSSLENNEIILKKGPVFQTAIISGTMAVKKTHEMIPFCHSIPIESCKFNISCDESLLVTITCEVKTNFKTGVEMEALHGAMTAALTIYDMCKAVSHEIEIVETKLLHKTGGKRTVLDKPLYGIVLTGGQSKRMKSPKALIEYQGLPHAQYIINTLQPLCKEVYLSARQSQWQGSKLETLPAIIDSPEIQGPVAGLMAAFSKHPDAYWFVVACDLPYFNAQVAQHLLAQFDSTKVATCFMNREKGFPEALCAIYTPSAQAVFTEALKANHLCPVKVLQNSDCHLIPQEEGINLSNINTQNELFEVLNEIN
jgi:cyclic pyranopterin phosphate synthase